MSDREALRAKLADEIDDALDRAHPGGHYECCYSRAAFEHAFTTAVMPVVEQLQADNEALRERLATADDDLARWRSFSERIRQDATAIPDDEPMDVVEDLPAYLRDLEVQHLMADNEALRQVVAKVTALADEWASRCDAHDFPKTGNHSDATRSDAGRDVLAVLAEVTPQPPQPLTAQAVGETHLLLAVRRDDLLTHAELAAKLDASEPVPTPESSQPEASAVSAHTKEGQQ